MPLPTTLSYEGRTVVIKASCDALLHMGTGELMKMWNSGLESSPVQPPPSLKAQGTFLRWRKDCKSENGGRAVKCHSLGMAQPWQSWTHSKLQSPARGLYKTGPANSHLSVGKQLMRSYPYFSTVSYWYLVKRGTTVFSCAPSVLAHQSTMEGSKLIQTALP